MDSHTQVGGDRQISLYSPVDLVSQMVVIVYKFFLHYYALSLYLCFNLKIDIHL